VGFYRLFYFANKNLRLPRRIRPAPPAKRKIVFSVVPLTGIEGEGEGVSPPTPGVEVIV